ncbi:MAG: hypothetical protein QG596_951 [Actinomycetota bacterium]|nr:hypothetical protein [Actinomycetota bacterium]
MPTRPVAGTHLRPRSSPPSRRADFSILVEAGPTGVGVDTDWAVYTGLPAMLAFILAIITVIIIFRRSRSAEANPATR